MQKKGQTWYLDFTLGMTIFAIGLIIFYNVTTNTQFSGIDPFEILQEQTLSLSNSLISSGFPEDWDEQSLLQLGLTNNDHILNNQKVARFANLNYTYAKNILGTNADFFVYFLNTSKRAVNVAGVCSKGHSSLSSSYVGSVAYYYSTGTEEFLREVAETEFNADVYLQGSAGNDLSDLIAAISTYDGVIFEYPDLTVADVASYNDDLQDFARAGGKIVMTGKIAPDGEILLGVQVWEKPTQLVVDKNATINITTPFYLLNGQENLFVDHATYIENNSITGGNFTLLHQYVDDQRPAAAKWKLGSGEVLFFSDTNGNQTSADLLPASRQAVRTWLDLDCADPPIHSIDAQNIIRIERFVSSQGRIIKMVVLGWQ